MKDLAQTFLYSISPACSKEAVAVQLTYALFSLGWKEILFLFKD